MLDKTSRYLDVILTVDTSEFERHNIHEFYLMTLKLN